MSEFLEDLIIATLVFLIPIGLGLYTTYENLFKPKSPEIAGYIYDGSRVFNWLVIILVISWVMHIVLYCIPGLRENSYLRQSASVLITDLVAQIVLILSYIMVSFRPATAEELQEAKAKRTLTMDVATALTGIGAAIVGTLAAVGAIILAALNPITIVRVVGNTVYYTFTSIATSIATFAVGMAILTFVFVVMMLSTEFYILLFLVFCAGAIIVRFIVLRKKRSQAFVPGESFTANFYGALKSKFIKKA